MWVGGCIFLACECVRRPSKVLWTVLTLFATATVVKLLFVDLPYWHVHPARFLYASRDYSFLEATMRSLDFGMIICFFAGAWWFCRHETTGRETRKLFGLAAIVLLFLYTTLEFNTFLEQFVEGFRAGGVSILWSVFALSFLAVGILRDRRDFRYSGLVLFGVVVTKVMVSDLEQLEPLFRIVAFIILGLLVLSGSLIYLRFREQFVLTSRTEPDDVE